MAFGFLGVLRLYAATEFEFRHARDLASQPPDVRLLVQLVGEAGRFRIGERIPLRLQFSSTLANTYRLNAATYDRSGRLPTEEFVMEQNDVVDPWRDYFGSGVMGGVGGGLRSLPPVLGLEPHEITLDLNDWFRFDRAGRYRFYLKSHRLENSAVVSNIVELEIVDDAAWREAQLARLRARLEQSDETARQELRTLGTPGAVELVLEIARQGRHGVDSLLLVGARDRAHAVAALDRYLADEAIAIGEYDVRLRALVTFVQRWGLPPLPTAFWQLQDERRLQEVIAEAERRQGLFAQFVREEAVRLIPVALKKQGEARKSSAREIGALALEEARKAGLVEPENYGLTRAELIAGFATFDQDRQGELLDTKWDLVRGPEMIPVLTKAVRGAPVGLQDVMMRRLRELSPAEAWGIVKQELVAGNLDFATMKEFPAVDVPEADAILRQRLREDPATALPLVARFGTVKLAGPMRELWARRMRSCFPEQEVVTYLARVFPAAEGEGREALRLAMRSREGRGCSTWLLVHVGRVVWSEAVQAEAIEALNDSDVKTAEGAALILAEQGDLRVEEPLWRRLELGGPEIRDGLMEAMGSARAWRLDDARRKRLLSFCPDLECRQRWAAGHPVTVDVSNGGSMYPVAFRVGGYTARTLGGLKQKLLQYPAGTAFRWCPQESNPIDSFTPGMREEMFRDLAGYLRPRGMFLERCPATGPGRN